eukprot:15301633-Heterocapsa_arctica.AAC.1
MLRGPSSRRAGSPRSRLGVAIPAPFSDPLTPCRRWPSLFMEMHVHGRECARRQGCWRRSAESLGSKVLKQLDALRVAVVVV